MKKWNVILDISWKIEAETQEEAEKIAAEDIDNYAGSNDGSEMIANAAFSVVEITA